MDLDLDLNLNPDADLETEPQTKVEAPLQKAASPATRLIYGTFYLGGDEFAIEMTDLQEVVSAPGKLQKMPLSPNYLLGLFNLRGQVLPVIDLHVLLHIGHEATDTEVPSRLAVLRRGAALLGLLFDSVGEIVRVAPEELMPVEQRNVDGGTKKMPVKALLCLKGGERLIQVLDLSALLAIKNLPSLERVPGRGETDSSKGSRLRDLYREKLIGFTVGECNLALEMKCVEAIIQNTGKKASPCRGELCQSIVMFVGRMVPVVPMAKILNLSSERPAERILICHVGDGQVGFEVDEVTGIIPYAKDRVLPVPVLSDHRHTIFHGCFTDRDGKDHIVLNEGGTLSTSEIREISFGHQRLSEKKAAEEAKGIVPQTTLITFHMGKLCGLRLLDVLEVLVCPKELVRPPDMPAAVLGVLNLRGTPVSVVDPRRLFDLEPATDLSASRILVFEHAKRKIAMRVDSVDSILSVSAGENDELPDIFFQTDQPVLQETFERGVHAVSDGVKTVVRILSADQIVKRLAAALDGARQ